MGSTSIVHGDITITGKANYATADSGNWNDLVMALVPPSSGTTIPTVSQVGSSPVSMPKFDINDHAFVSWHIPHKYALNTDVYFHMHWLSAGVDVTRAVKWQFTYYHAKGHNQAAFALGGAGTVISAQEVSGGQYRHMITETTAITIAGLEPDSVVLCEIKRITNGGTDNTDDIFGFQADIHHQCDALGTKNRAPDFYA
jgi:hypothetical protein